MLSSPLHLQGEQIQMNAQAIEALIVRQLTSSDLGWFAALRDSGGVPSKQRAINFNAAIIAAILPAQVIELGEVIVRARCLRPEALQEEDRPLSKVGKNWRLGGHKVPGIVFLYAKPGDFFVSKLKVTGEPRFELSWTVVTQSLEPEEHSSIASQLGPHLADRMALFSNNDALFTLFEALLSSSPPRSGSESPQQIPSSDGLVPALSKPIPKRTPRKLTVKERLRQPHIMGEMVKLSLSHSSEAQKHYLDALETLAGAIRDMLDSAGMIQTVKIDHARMWARVAGRPIAFVDGGVANVASLGAEPVAIRVGSYTVTPGSKDASREVFRMEKQLVAELFDMHSAQGIFDDLFEDPSKLRDVARFCLEVAGGTRCLTQTPKPAFLFLHGALVNPVSAYADRDFPAFSQRGLEIFLPPEERNRTGRDAKFVCVYLRLLQMLQEAHINVASVVERASASTIVSRTLLEGLKSSPVSPGASILEDAIQKIQDYRIPDAVLFHAILNEGEYLSPVQVDRNVAHKRPQYSADVIANYPLPALTYVGVGEHAQPLRVEFFEEPPDGYGFCVSLVIHSCRLMPNYAFPAGLDIVDKFAKVPNWMSRPINSTMAVQLLKRAIDNGNPKIIEAAKRMLCGTKRDWLFRPDYIR
jgi:hypothetical protein